jgi:hypothetical protein
MVTENKKLICSIFILLCLGLAGAISVLPHDEIEILPETIHHTYVVPKGNIILDDTDVYIEVRYPETGIKITEEILSDRNFSNWSVEDQRLLADMMRVTAQQRLGISDASEFSGLVDGAPGHVLEAYIALLENAGY